MLAEKLLKIQTEQVRVTKDGKNPHFKSAYVTLDALNTVLLPILSDNGVVVTHNIEDNFLKTTAIDVETKEQIVSSFPIFQEDPQKIGSTITYAKRYNLGAIFNIITEVDDDGNSVSGENFTKTEAKWLNYSDLVSIADAGNTTEEQVARIIREDGYKLSQNAKNAVRHYVETGEIDKNLFFKK